MSSSPHPFTLRQLQYAVSVADTRSFRRASEVCRVAQPSLSAQVAALEQGLGLRLFDRDRRGVMLTSAGEEVIERARRLIIDGHELTGAATRHLDPLTGLVRIGVIPTISAYLLPALVPILGRALPRLALHWTEDKTDALVAAVNAGTLDGALLAVEARLGELEHEVIAQDAFVLAAPAGHPLVRRRGPAKLHELNDHAVLLLDEGHCLREQALTVCTRAGTRELDFRATSLPTLVQMVAAGAGVTLLPTLAIASETRRAKVVTRPLAAPAPHRTLAVAWRRGSSRAPALHAVAEAARTAHARVVKLPHHARPKSPRSVQGVQSPM